MGYEILICFAAMLTLSPIEETRWVGRKLMLILKNINTFWCFQVSRRLWLYGYNSYNKSF